MREYLVTLGLFTGNHSLCDNCDKREVHELCSITNNLDEIQFIQ